MEYTAGRGTTALGVVGTVLGGIGTAAATGVLGGNGMNLFGNGNNAANVCNDNMPVSRYDLAQKQEIAALQTENALLKADKYTDQKFSDLNDRYNERFRNIEAQLAAQAVHNATNDAVLGCMQGQIAQLYGLTKLIVPATSVCPAPMPQYNSWTAPTTASTT